MTLKIKAGTPRRMDDSDTPTFEGWMQRVDALVWRLAGLSAMDLPDSTYRDMYDKRTRPCWAAKRALRRAGGPE